MGPGLALAPGNTNARCTIRSTRRARTTGAACRYSWAAMLVSELPPNNSSIRNNLMADAGEPRLGRREFVRGAVTGAALAVTPAIVLAASAGKSSVLAQI